MKDLLSSALENEPGLKTLKNLKFYTSNFLLINISEGICQILDHFDGKPIIKLESIIFHKLHTV